MIKGLNLWENILSLFVESLGPWFSSLTHTAFGKTQGLNEPEACSKTS